MNEPVTLVGRDLAAARRALAVWLMTDLHEMSDGGPTWDEAFALLDHLDWPGSPERPIELDVERRRVLGRVVFDTLEAAASESTHAAHSAFVTGAARRPIDARTLHALEWLAGLAARLMGAGPDGTQHDDHNFDTEPVADGFATLADGLGLPVWMAGPEFEVVWVNNACEALFGVPRRMLVGSCFRDWWVAADRERAVAAADAAKMELRAFSVRGVAATGDARPVPTLGVVVPRRSPAGELLGWAGVWFADGEARPSRGWVADLEGAQTVSGATLHALLGHLPGMIWTTDRDLRCTSSLGAGLDELGLHPNQIVGVTLCEFVGTDDPDHPARRAHVSALDGVAGSYRDRRGDRTYEVRVEPLVGAAGSVVGTLGISRDVTDAVAWERARETLLRQLNFAQSVAGVGSWECDLVTGEWLWSDEGYRLLGYEPGEIAPSFDAFVARVHPEDRPVIADLHTRGLQTGDGYEASYRVVLPGGASRLMSGVVRFDWNDDGVLVRIVGLIRRHS